MKPLDEQQNDNPEEISPGLAAPQADTGIPEQPTEPNTEQPKKTTKKKWLFVAAGLIVLVGLGYGAFALTRDEPSVKKAAPTKTVAAEDKSGAVFCVKVGLKSLQCEELATKEVRKFILPDVFGKQYYLSASPDGTKFMATSSTDGTDSVIIYDSKVNKIAAIPDSEKFSLYDVEWNSNNTIIYIDSENSLNTKTNLKVFDISTSKIQSSIDLNVDIERVMPLGDGQRVYGIQADIDKSQDRVVRKLVLINLKTKQILDVANTLEESHEDSITYNLTSSRFYVNKLRQAEQSYTLEIYSAADLDTKPKLSLVSKIEDVHAGGTVAYEVYAIQKQYYATRRNSDVTYPHLLFTEDGKSTDLSLGVGAYGSGIMLFLPSFPNFQRAESNEIVTSDLFHPAKDVPEKIVKFVEAMAIKQEGCSKGEYQSFEIGRFDGDRQFSLSKSGCNSGYGIQYYSADGNTYKVIGGNREGIYCDYREQIGLSKVVEPECLRPNEGI